MTLYVVTLTIAVLGKPIEELYELELCASVPKIFDQFNIGSGIALSQA